MFPSLALSLGGLILVIGSWLHYLWLMPREAVPARPDGHLSAVLGGCFLAFSGLLFAGDWFPAALLLALLAGPLSASFLFLLGEARQPAGAARLALGAPLPELQAQDAEGQTVRSADWRGRRVLIKVFRGHW